MTSLPPASPRQAPHSPRDSSSASSPRACSMMTSSRMNKHVQGELELLRHRLLKLRLQEERAQQRLESAARRAANLERRQQLYAEEHRLRAEHADGIAQQRLAMQAAVAAEKQRQAEALRSARDREAQRRLHDMAQIRFESTRNKALIKLQRLEEQKHNLEKRKQIRELELSVRSNRERQSHRRMEEVRQSIQRDIDRDERGRNEAAEQVQRMHREEAELMQRLQHLREQERLTAERAQLAGSAGRHPNCSPSSRPHSGDPHSSSSAASAQCER